MQRDADGLYELVSEGGLELLAQGEHLGTH